MNRPRLLDVFCGAGGASVGYHRAGYDVVGVDAAVMPAYPFLDVVQGDAFAVLADRDYCAGFDLIHASPPCQQYTALRNRTGRTYPDLVAPVRAALAELGVPYVIENVVGAPLLEPVTLCGTMFGLGLGGAVLRRHRLFETSFALPATPAHECRGRATVGVYGTGGNWTRTAPGGGGVKVSGAQAAAVLGVDWTRRQRVLAQMIPPAYTEWIGRAAMNACPSCARVVRGSCNRGIGGNSTTT